MKRLFYFFCVILSVQLAQAQYFFEDFSGGSIPSTWTIKQTNAQHTWEISQQTETRYEAVCTAFANSGDVDEWLITPSFSLEGSTKPYMELITNFNYIDIQNDDLVFEVLSSIDNGQTWEKLWDANQFYYWLDYYNMIANKSMDNLKGQPNVKLAFRVKGLNPELQSSVWIPKVTVKEDTRVMPESINIVVDGGGPAEVNAGEKLELKSVVTPSTANQKAVWTIQKGEDLASNFEGTIYADYPGEVVVRAASVDNPSIYKDIVVTILKKSDTCNQEFNGPLSAVLGINNSHNQLVANDITIQPNTKFNFTGIKMVVNYDIASAGTYPTFQLNVYEDHNGQPGKPIKHLEDLNVTTGGSGTYQIIEIQFPESFDFPIVDAATKYWIGITANDDGFPIRWTAYTVSDNSLPAMGSSDNGETWAPKQNEDGIGLENIFQILGTCETLDTKEIGSANIRLYPNPVKDILHIANDTKISEVSIFDLQGKLYHAYKSSEEINVKLLPKGVYVVKIKDVNQKIYTQKIIKE